MNILYGKHQISNQSLNITQIRNLYFHCLGAEGVLVAFKDSVNQVVVILWTRIKFIDYVKSSAVNFVYEVYTRIKMNELKTIYCNGHYHAMQV